MVGWRIKFGGIIVAGDVIGTENLDVMGNVPFTSIYSYIYTHTYIYVCVRLCLAFDNNL